MSVVRPFRAGRLTAGAAAARTAAAAALLKLNGRGNGEAELVEVNLYRLGLFQESGPMPPHPFSADDLL